MSNLTDQEWRNKLTPEQYRVLRGKGTELPGSGQYDQHFVEGQYTCAGCGAELFSSQSKFEAGCGWPSFYQAKDGAVNYTLDESHGMVRTEVTCAKCDGHLGHIFEGEGFATPTDKRYCINSVSLNFGKK